jgi:hypothetical protein
MPGPPRHSPVAPDPGEGALDNPASRLNGEADLIGGLAHDLEGASSPMPATLANASPAPPQSLDEGE